MDSPGGASNGSALSAGGRCVAGGASAPPGDDADDAPAGWNCSVHPSVFFLLGTLVLTSCSTAMLCAAIMTDHWEEVTWDQDKLSELVAEKNNATITALADHTTGTPGTNRLIHLHWLLHNTVARVTTIPVRHETEESRREKEQRGGRSETPKAIAFLVPMHGGIWTLCVSLEDEDVELLGRVGFPPVDTCVNYLAGGLDAGVREEPRAIWQHRMQNLSISCALVCLIVLGSAALVGAFGVCQHQISAVLVTGVMYLLAASFALFTLTIIHFKRMHGAAGEHADGTVDGVVGTSAPVLLLRADGGAQSEILRSLLSARVFSTAWSLDLGWGGVMLTVMTSVLWILLSKIMRFNPISSMIHY